MSKILSFVLLFALGWECGVAAQQAPYDVFPPAEPPYYRVRYEASTQTGELVYPVKFTVWIPPVATLRGVIVHQHGCGEGSCKSGLTGAYDLHWQALARKHDCALLSPSYEQPEGADCQMWCDPRNGSAQAFQQSLVDLGKQAGHLELAEVPWTLWGHSGGGHWAGGMLLLHPQRVVAAWLRSGVPLFSENPERPSIRPHTLPAEALQVPIMCNLGTKEGVTVKDGRFAGVWPANQDFFTTVRGQNGLVGVAIDPLTAHECGNQRYLAIAWLDACLTARLPATNAEPLKAMPTDEAWLATLGGVTAKPADTFDGEATNAVWLPNESIARAWMQYVKDAKLDDATPPPAPTEINFTNNELTWSAVADLESGLAGFVIERDGKFLANVPEEAKNPFGRPLFQGLQYSDTPTQPLVEMRFTDPAPVAGKAHQYRVIAVNTVGLKSTDSAGKEVNQAAGDAAVPKPTLANVPYGEHPRHVLDFWQANSAVPTPVVLVIHGGGWKSGEKERASRFVDIERLLASGISVAAINYRLMSHANEAHVQPPVKAPLHDAARALQFLRSRAKDWNIDKAQIGASGGSAGACSSLWLAFHDDLADPSAEDPVLRESTRLYCAAVLGAQTTLDPQQMQDWTPNSRYGAHAFGVQGNFAEFLSQRESLLPWIAEYSPYALVSADDPPVYLSYSAKPALGQEQKDPTHTANFGVKLQEHCRATGVACELVYPGAPDVGYETPTDYLIAKLGE